MDETPFEAWSRTPVRHEREPWDIDGYCLVPKHIVWELRETMRLLQERLGTPSLLTLGALDRALDQEGGLAPRV